MAFFESMVLNVVYLTFPFCIYFIYLGYAKNLKKKEKRIFLDIALYSSAYLVMRYGGLLGSDYPVLLFNVPLLISYQKDRKWTASFLSIVLILYHVLVLNIPFVFAFSEYVFYFVTYTWMTKRMLKSSLVLNVFILIRSLFLSIQTVLFYPGNQMITSFLSSLFLMLVFYIITYLILYLLQEGEAAMNLSSTVKELEKEKMLRASLFKITHEIKNPIAVCKGYLDMLDLKNEKKLEQYIPIVKQEIGRTLTLMDDYLDYTKVKIEKEEVDFYLLIEDTIAALDSLFKVNEVETDFEIPEEELYLSLDYNRMKQVLYNLFKNAIEARDETKRTMKISLEVKLDDKEVKLIITDNGQGMEEETLKHISEMFYTTKQKGSGLGVALSKEIVELHGGTLSYESKFGSGTKAILSLPLVGI